LNTTFKVGLFVLVISIISAFLIIKFSGKELGVEKKYYYIYFKHVAGLSIGAEVEVNGVRAGRVEDIKFEKDRIKVKIYVRKDIPIYKNAKAYIKTLGLMGDKYIYIDNGDPQYGELPDGAVITTSKVYATTEEAFATAEEVAGKLNKILDEIHNSIGKGQLKKLVENINKLIENTNSMVQENRQDIKKSITNIKVITDELKTDLPDMIKKIDKVAENLEQITSENRENFKELIANLKDTSKALKEKTPKVLDDIDKATVVLKDTIQENREDVHVSIQHIKESSKKLDSILAKIDKGQGTIGKLVTEDKLYNQVSEGVESFSKPFKILNESNLDISIYGEKHTGNDDTKGGIGLAFSPASDRYYYFGLISNSNGSISKEKEVTTNSGTTTTVSRDYGILVDFQYALKIATVRNSSLWFRGGLKESSGALGLDFLYSKNFKITSDIYKFNRDEALGEPDKPELDIGILYRFKKNPFFLKFGGSDLLNADVRGVYFGGGLMFRDNYIKYLLGAMSVPVQ